MPVGPGSRLGTTLLPCRFQDPSLRQLHIRGGVHTPRLWRQIDSSRETADSPHALDINLYPSLPLPIFLTPFFWSLISYITHIFISIVCCQSFFSDLHATKTRIFVDFTAVSRGLELCLAKCLQQELKEGMLSVCLGALDTEMQACYPALPV